MTQKTRWIQSAIDQAGKTNTKMPWERGTNREAFVASRRVLASLQTSKSRTHLPAA